MKEKLFKKLLDKYEKGNVNDREKNVVDFFLTSLQSADKSSSEVQYDLKLKNRILKKIKKKSQEKTKQVYKGLALAATLLLLIGSYAYFSNFSSLEPVEYTEISTRKGERKKIILSDSSEVILNADSKIAFPKEFSEGKREIKLDGEAYFSVTPDPDRPFIISSDDFVTQVLGTRFTIKSYPKETSEVVVLSGKVRVVNKKNKSQTLTKDQRVRIIDNNILLERVNSRAVTSWLQNKIRFEKSTPEQIARILNRRYNMKVLIDESLTEQPALSGNFSGNTIWDVLESIEFIFGIEYRKIDENTIELFNND